MKLKLHTLHESPSRGRWPVHEPEIASVAWRIIPVLTLALLGWSPGVFASLAPDQLARSTTDEVMQIVSQDKDIKAGNRGKIDRLVEAKILPHFDFAAMAQLAMGHNWSAATPAQRQKIVGEFRTLLVRSYAGALSSVSRYKVEFKPLHMQSGAVDVTVDSEVQRPGSPPLSIDYHMKKEGEGWKVYDVLVDHASLVTVYRSSFNSSVRQHGIDGLITALANRNERNEGGGR